MVPCALCALPSIDQFSMSCVVVVDDPNIAQKHQSKMDDLGGEDVSLPTG